MMDIITGRAPPLARAESSRAADRRRVWVMCQVALLGGGIVHTDTDDSADDLNATVEMVAHERQQLAA